MEWEILMTEQVEEFLNLLHEVDRDSHRLVNQAILVLERSGPSEGRPPVDSITASRITNIKELRPPAAGRSEPGAGVTPTTWSVRLILPAVRTPSTPLST